MRKNGRPHGPISEPVLPGRGEEVAGVGVGVEIATPAACCIPAITPVTDQGLRASRLNGTPVRGDPAAGCMDSSWWWSTRRLERPAAPPLGTVTAGLVCEQGAKAFRALSASRGSQSLKNGFGRTHRLMSPRPNPQVQGQERRAEHREQAGSTPRSPLSDAAP